MPAVGDREQQAVENRGRGGEGECLEEGGSVHELPAKRGRDGDVHEEPESDESAGGGRPFAGGHAGERGVHVPSGPVDDGG